MNKHSYFDLSSVLALRRRRLGIACLLAVCVVVIAAFIPLPIHAQDQPKPIGNRLDAHKAVVHIFSVGRFQRYGEAKERLEFDGGTGFIVDPEGIVVTNAHVVNGGNLFRVALDGETEPRNAVLLGVSECSDLAVLDIRGSGFPYLAWQQGPVREGQTVMAAGYPSGNYTETSGQIEIFDVPHDSSWASIGSVIGHTARLRPGNSGGPLLNAFGEVVGVNYAGSERFETYAAIAKEVAIPVVEQLRGGVDVDSVGVNGEAFDDGGSDYGVWVTAVKTGSPADKAGLQPGDIITALEGLPVGYKGGMGVYCDVLRSHKATDAIAFTAVRYGQEFSREFSGQATAAAAGAAAPGQADAEPLAVQPEAVVTPEAVTQPESVAQPEETGSGQYHEVSNKAGSIVVSVPTEWDTIKDDVSHWGSVVTGPILMVANISFATDTYQTPLILVIASDTGSDISESEDLNTIKTIGSCTLYQRQNVHTLDFSGVADVWTDCNGFKGHSALTAVLTSSWNKSLRVGIVLNRLELVQSLETVIQPLGSALRSKPKLYDIPTAGIAADVLNIRSGPGTTYDKVGTVTAGDSVIVFGRDGTTCGWYYIAKGKTEGWISADPEYSQLDRDCGKLEIITAEMIRQWKSAANK